MSEGITTVSYFLLKTITRTIMIMIKATTPMATPMIIGIV